MDCHHLFGIAKTAYERAKENAEELTSGRADAIVAMLFSAATLEAFIGEFAERAHNTGSDTAKHIADVLGELEENRASLRVKFLVLSELLGKRAYTKGSQPYQDFDLLINIRNTIVHMKPESLKFEPDNIVKDFQSRGLCARPVKKPTITTDDLPHLIRDIATPAAARWACGPAIGASRDGIP